MSGFLPINCFQKGWTGPIFPNETTDDDTLGKDADTLLQDCSHPKATKMLFDIYADPSETNDLKHKRPEVYAGMKLLMDEVSVATWYRQSFVKDAPLDCPHDEKSCEETFK